MNRLEELIKELCPNGVEYQPLGTVAHYAKKRIDASNVNENTYVGVENLLQNKQGKTAAASIPKTGAVIAFEPGNVLIGNIRPYLRKVWLADCRGGTNGDVLAVQIENEEKLLPAFLYYVLSSEQFFLYDIQNSKGAKMPRGSKEAVMNYFLPVPPLPVQREIVQILDNFADSNCGLIAELTAELSIRKQQYKYYRDKLLRFDVPGKTDSVEWKRLGEIADTFRGEYITKKSAKAGNIPVILGGQEPAYYIDRSNHCGEIVAVARSGVSAGFVSYWNEPIFITDGFGFEAKEDVVTPKFLYYILKNKEAELNAMKCGAGVPHVSGEALREVLLPIPAKREQERMAAILDRFDTICNSLTSSLSAEIKARQKQYEYYQGRLLSFPEKSS